MDTFQICQDTRTVSYIGGYLVLTLLEKLITSTSHFCRSVNCISQKQPPDVFCEKRSSWKFRRIHRSDACNFIKKETGTGVFL